MSQSIRDRQDDIEGIVDERQRDLVTFLKEMKAGNLRKAKALWTLTRVHLSDRKVDWYFSTLIDAGVIEVYSDGREQQFRFIREPVREGKEESFTEYANKENVRRLIRNANNAEENSEEE